MTRVRAAVAWLLLVPVGTVLLMGALVVGLPSALLGFLGVRCWQVADRLLRRPRPEVGDDTVAMLEEDAGRDTEDAYWRAYLSHPSAQAMARRQVRGDG